MSVMFYFILLLHTPVLVDRLLCNMTHREHDCDVVTNSFTELTLYCMICH